MCGEGISSLCPQVSNEPCRVLELSGSCLTLSIPWQVKIPDALHGVIWDRREANRPTPPVLCDNAREHQEASESLVRVCPDQVSFALLSAHSQPWWAVDLGGRAKATGVTQWPHCVRDTGTDLLLPCGRCCRIWQLPCQGWQQQLWGQHWTHPAAPGWYLGLGCNSWAEQFYTRRERSDSLDILTHSFMQQRRNSLADSLSIDHTTFSCSERARAARQILLPGVVLLQKFEEQQRSRNPALLHSA